MQSLSSPDTLLAISFLERALRRVDETPIDDCEALKEIDRDLSEAYRLINALPRNFSQRNSQYFVPVTNSTNKLTYSITEDRINRVKRNIQNLITDLKGGSRIKLPTFC